MEHGNDNGENNQWMNCKQERNIIHKSSISTINHMPSTSSFSVETLLKCSKVPRGTNFTRQQQIIFVIKVDVQMQNILEFKFPF